MPVPGQPNNPGGVNGLYEREAPYGAIKRLQQSIQAAPISPNPATNAPRKAQRAAVSGGNKSPAPPQDYPTWVAQQWAGLASIPGASPLVQDLAARAAQQVTLYGSS